LSTTDYRLVGAKNTATGKYTNSYAVGDDNSVSLNVMDPNTGDLDQVTITDIAKASDIQDVKDNAVLYDNTGKDSVTLKGTERHEDYEPERWRHIFYIQRCRERQPAL
jgi:hypothetical protein